jgi:hypothetical protein
MQFSDRLTLDGAMRRTSDGYAVLSAKVARAGNVQLYLGSEVGVTDKAMVRVYRPADQVFSRDAIKSYAGVPVTVGHPKASVTAESWKDLAVGEVGDDVLRDGEFVRVPMMLRDAKAIAKVEAGTRELSMGYEAEITMHDGVSPSGEKFDAIMSGFKMNHVAIVDQARGGSELRIGDEALADKWGAAPISVASTKEPTPMKTFTVDGISVEMSDTAIQVVQKVLGQLNDAKTEAADANTKIGELTAAVSTKDGEIAVLKQQVTDAAMTPAKLDAAVQARAAVISDAKAIAGKELVTDGKTDDEIRKAAVTAKLGDKATGLDDAGIKGAFHALAAAVAKADPVRDAIRDGLHSTDITDLRAQAEASRLKRDQALRDGHRTAAA